MLSGMNEPDIEIRQLRPGERVPEGADWIRIDRLSNGKYEFSGSVVLGVERGAVFNSGAGPTYDSFAEAKLAGVLWAQERGAQVVYVGAPDA